MADVSVRPARTDDAAEIGRIQVETWGFGYRDVLPAGLLDGLTADSAALTWQDAITAPPTPRHRVLVATEGASIVGFAAAGPPDDVEPDDPPADATTEVVQLLVEPRWRRRGHGSRLMAALTDLARDDAITRATMWIPEADTVLREFLAGAGWDVDGLARALDTGAGELREIRLHTVLDALGT